MALEVARADLMDDGANWIRITNEFTWRVSGLRSCGSRVGYIFIMLTRRIGIVARAKCLAKMSVICARNIARRHLQFLFLRRRTQTSTTFRCSNVSGPRLSAVTSECHAKTRRHTVHTAVQGLIERPEQMRMDRTRIARVRARETRMKRGRNGGKSQAIIYRLEKNKSKFRILWLCVCLSAQHNELHDHKSIASTYHLPRPSHH